MADPGQIKEKAAVVQTSSSTSTAHNTNTKTGFLSLPGEVRNRIYEQVLLHPKAINLRLGYVQLHRRAPGLLRTCRTVHQEASPLFYGQNCFDFATALPWEAMRFLEQIGPRNASCIRHVLIEFPRFRVAAGVASTGYPGSMAGRRGHPPGYNLDPESVRNLEYIQRACPRLASLTTDANSTMTTELKLNCLVSDMAVTMIIRDIDARFRACPSVQTIHIEMGNSCCLSHVHQAMEVQGWTVTNPETAERMEWVRTFRDPDEDASNDEAVSDEDKDEDENEDTVPDTEADSHPVEVFAEMTDGNGNKRFVLPAALPKAGKPRVYFFAE